MLAIVSSDRCYVNELLEKISYTKELSPNKTEVYRCNYKDHEFLIMVLGYGKINTGSSLRFICEKHKVRAILVVGTCGSVSDSNDVFTAVIPSSSLEFDVDFMPNGYMQGVIPKLSKGIYKTDDDLNDCLKRASSLAGVSYTDDLIASSDMFVSNYGLANSIRREYNASAVDCECGGVGEFCFINNIAYACVKVVSNFANNNGIKQFNLYDNESSKIAQKITYKFLNEFYEA